VPVFAVGRAQELLMLLDEHWQRTELQVMPTLPSQYSR
jgi:Cft2 family RNA processing exonuclease